MRPRRFRRRPAAGIRAEQRTAPRSTRMARLALDRRVLHITRFIAGARNNGASVAGHSVVSRSSARPGEARDQIGEAGAISTRCAQRASPMWPIEASGAVPQRGAHRLAGQGWKVSAVTKRSAFSVSTTRTCARARAGDAPDRPPCKPRFRRSRRAGCAAASCSCPMPANEREGATKAWPHRRSPMPERGDQLTSNPLRTDAGGTPDHEGWS